MFMAGTAQRPDSVSGSSLPGTLNVRIKLCHSTGIQGSKKYRTYDRAVVAKQGCFEDAHVSELIIPHNLKDTGKDR